MSAELDKITEETLWQIALTRAEIRELKFLTLELLSLQTGKSMQSIQDKYKTEKEDAAKVWFRKSALAAGLGNPPIPEHNGEI